MKAASTDVAVHRRCLRHPPWCFEDEATDWSADLLQRLIQGDRITVPAHWPTEVSNALLLATRRSRITLATAKQFWDELALLPIHIESSVTPAEAKTILDLCVQHRLPFYDATYLELALKLAPPLATLDEALQEAGRNTGVTIVCP
jgi:predicted nucleic acid-binding protein